MAPKARDFRINPERYDFHRVLGSGSYGTVQSYFDKGIKRCVAIKRIACVFDDFLITRRTLREIRLMRHFNHSNIVRMVDVFMIDSDLNPEELNTRNNSKAIREKNPGYTPPMKVRNLIMIVLSDDVNDDNQDIPL